MDHRNMDEKFPLGQPIIRQWEINENATRYERLQAAPSDDSLMIMWTSWSWISGAVAIFISLVLVAILVNRKARSNPFNLYLVFLLVPDLICAGFCALTCLLNVVAGQYWSDSMCQFQSFYLVFGVAANSWLNLCVAQELHSFLKSSRVLRKHVLPTMRRVTCTALAVYVYSCFIASWALWSENFDNFPSKTASIYGLVCLPLEYNQASSLFFYLVFFPLLTGIPLVWALGIGAHVWYHRLMPPTGKRRVFTIFFVRSIVVYVVMWVPYFIVGLAGSRSPWLVFAAGSWGHLQGVVSSSIVLTKPDIWHAFVRLLRCQCCSPDPTQLPVQPAVVSTYPSTLPMMQSQDDRDVSIGPRILPTTNEEEEIIFESGLDADDDLFG
jgi:hypothetical protein